MQFLPGFCLLCGESQARSHRAAALIGKASIHNGARHSQTTLDASSCKNGGALRSQNLSASQAILAHAGKDHGEDAPPYTSAAEQIAHPQRGARILPRRLIEDNTNLAVLDSTFM